jgi:hypothetical protein
MPGEAGECPGGFRADARTPPGAPINRPKDERVRFSQKRLGVQCMPQVQLFLYVKRAKKDDFCTWTRASPEGFCACGATRGPSPEPSGARSAVRSCHLGVDRHFSDGPGGSINWPGADWEPVGRRKSATGLSGHSQWRCVVAQPADRASRASWSAQLAEKLLRASWSKIFAAQLADK